jgi:hypothetical protein
MRKERTKKEEIERKAKEEMTRRKGDNNKVHTTPNDMNVEPPQQTPPTVNMETNSNTLNTPPCPKNMHPQCKTCQTH